MIEGYDNKFLQKFDYETTAISNKKIIGTCELGKATIQLLNEGNDFSDMKETWIKTKFGSFYIYDVKPVQEKVNIKLSCYDIKFKLDTKYDSSLYTWPMTLKEWRNAIFTNCNVTFDNSDFPNSNLVLDKEPNIGNAETNRQVICIIAQAGVSWVEADTNDKLYFKWFTATVHTIEDWSSLTTEKTPTKPINLAVLSRGDVEDIVYYPKQKPDNPVEFKIDNNYILDPQDVTSNEDLRETTIIPIYNRVNGFKYIVYKMTTMQVENKLSINLGDKIKYIDTWENELESYVMKRKISYIGGNIDDDDNYEIELSAETIDETNSNLKLGVDVIKKISDIGVKVDKQNEVIQLVNSKVNDNSEKIAEIEITNKNITSSVKEIEETISGKNEYELTSDTVYASDKEYYSMNENGEYILLSEGEDYSVGDTINSNVYEKTTTTGLVQEVDSSLELLNKKVDEVKTEQTSQKFEISVISKNIDSETGEVRSVSTENGYTFNKEGLHISSNENNFNALHNEKGTYYKDGESILTQFTINNTIIKNLILYGLYYYGVDDELDVANFKKDDAMFVAQKIVDSNNEECFGHFYNGGN